MTGSRCIFKAQVQLEICLCFAFARQAALRSKFLSAATSIDAASRERSATEQDIEAELRKAMAAGPAAQTDQPQALPVPTLHMTCSPDLSRCPLGWVRNKNICVRSKAGPENNRCGSKYSFGALSQSQKEALAESCGWTFPCQTDQCQMNFEEICPTLWREERGGACLAPASYVGACGEKIYVQGRSVAVETFRSF